MTREGLATSRRLRAVLWTARITSVPIVGFLLLTAGWYPLHPVVCGIPLTATERFGLALFPLGLCLGYIVAWRWPLAGGVISLLCLGAFFVVMGIDLDLISFWLVVAIPALLFVVYAFLFHRERKGLGSG